MTFITASLAVTGFAAVAVPVAVHLLFRRRRAPVEWAAMRFLLDAYRRHHRRLQIEPWLLLFVRCLIPVLLGLALARPILERAALPAIDRSRTVCLIIDDGMASGLQIAPHRTALDGHTARAVGIVRRLGAADRVCVITAARPSAVLRPPTTDHAAVVDLLSSLRPQPSRTNLAGALEQLGRIRSDAEAGGAETIVFLLSEFRVGSADLLDPLGPVPGPAPSANGTRFFAARPSATAVLNVQIAGVEPSRAVLLSGAEEETGRVEARLIRRGGELDEQTTDVRVIAGGMPAGAAKIVRWASGQSEARVSLPLEVTGLTEREAAFTIETGDDPLSADNRYHLLLPIRRRIEVVLVDRREFGFEPAVDRLTAGQWIQRALAPAPGEEGPVSVLEAEPISLTAADVQSADAVIAPRPDLITDPGWAILRRFVNRGGLLIITPTQDRDVHAWVEHLRGDLGLSWAVGQAVRDEPESLSLSVDVPQSALLRRLAGDLPELVAPVHVQRFLPVEVDVDLMSSAETLLLLSDGSPLVLAESPVAVAAEAGGQALRSSPGLVILFSAAPELDWTNLPTKPLMVPLFQELLREGLSVARSGEPVRVGDAHADAALAPHPTAASLIDPDGAAIEVMPSGRLARPLARPGMHRVLDGAGQEIGRLAVNVDSAAGDPTPQSAAAVRAWLERSGPWEWIDDEDPLAAGAGSRGGSSLAGLLLFLLLAVIVLEAVLARMFSRASTRPGAAAADAIRPTMYERSALTSREGKS